MTNDAQGRKDGAANDASQPGRQRILIVDDDPVTCLHIQRRLERNDFEVLVAKTAEEALVALAAPVTRTNRAIAAVLLDVMMPGMSGLDALREIRAHRPAADLPVIICSGREGSSDIVEALRLGANDYLVKPFNIDLACARIDIQIDIVRLARQHAEKDALAALGALLVTHNHEINGLLTIANGQLARARSATTLEQAEQHMAKVQHALERIAAAVRQGAAPSRAGSTFEQYVEKTRTIRQKIS